jgi:two-component system chemotaxis response regulator CheY
MPETTPGAGPTPPALNILIVDDSAMMRAMIKRVAHLCGVPIANIYEAGNGLDAVRVLETHHVDAIFTDITMPVMTGPELLREVDRHERWRRVTRVIIGTDGSTARREEVKDLNVRLYVEKPFRPEVMRDVLTEIAVRPDGR